MTTTGRGFTLTELLIVTAITSLVAAALGSMVAWGFRTQASRLSKHAADTEAAYVIARINRDMYRASHLTLPALSAEDDRLEGYIGRLYSGAAGAPVWLNPATGDQTGTYTRFLHCRDNQGQWLRREDVYPIATDAAPVAACGSGPGWESLVTAPRSVIGRSPGGRLFSRLAVSRANVVGAAFDLLGNVQQSAAPLEVRTSLRAEFAAQTPL